MSKTLTLREANQSFARCVRAVEAGEEFVITRNGTPVARLVPVAGQRVLALQAACRAGTDPLSHARRTADRGGQARPRRAA